jgi:hypothetical protein
MVPRTTAGATSGTEELTSNDVMQDYMEFDKTTEQACQYSQVMPENWDRSTVKVKFIWENGEAGGAGNVVWGVRASAASEGDPLDRAWGTAQTVTDAITTDGDNHTTAATAALTVGGSPALGDVITWEFYRDADASADTFDKKARLLHVVIQYKRSGSPAAW